LSILPCCLLFAQKGKPSNCIRVPPTNNYINYLQKNYIKKYISAYQYRHIALYVSNFRSLNKSH
jgi:hypothetical protein